MLMTPYQNLEFPLVHYNKHTAIKGSGWSIKPHYAFFKTRKVTFKYQIFWTLGVDISSPEFYETRFKAQLARCGLEWTQATNVNPGNNIMVTSETLEENFKKAKESGVSLVILIIPQIDRSDYRQLKITADRKVGIQSICIVERMNEDESFFVRYMSNISMKINLKFGGINHTALQPNERYGAMDTMIIGADLIHPATGTIAAVVASVDDVAAKYLGSVRLQPVQDSQGPITDREVRTWLLGVERNTNNIRLSITWKTWSTSASSTGPSSTPKSSLKRSFITVMVSAKGITKRSKKSN